MSRLFPKFSRSRLTRVTLEAGAALAALATLAVFGSAPASADALQDQLLDVAKRRKLSSDDLFAAASTYTPTTKRDEFLCLNSGGQAGSVIVYGVPSMRILKYIPTAAPDSTTGFNYDEQSKGIL